MCVTTGCTADDPRDLGGFELTLVNLGLSAQALHALGDAPTSSKSISLFGEPDPDGAGLRPSMAFRPNDATEVISPVTGEVVQALEQPTSNDWELHIRPRLAPDWLVILDHVKEVAPTVGDSIAAGELIGEAAPWGGGGVWFELHVIHFLDSPSGIARHVCPAPLLEAGASSLAMQAVLSELGLPSSGCACLQIDEPRRRRSPLTCSL